MKTLLLPFENGQLMWPAGPVLFLNGYPYQNLPEGVLIQQYFKIGGAVPDIPEKRFDMVLLAGCKQQQEMHFMMGTALACLNDGGLFVCASANDEGGKRLKKDCGVMGLTPSHLSKHKCQLVWAHVNGQTMPEWFEGGAMQKIINDRYWSQPGIFGWDKIDEGSALLTQHLPEKLAGVGADFGCGYGFLSDFVLARPNDISALYCLDADGRAVKACEKNLSAYDSVDKEYIWADLTRPQTDLPALDWIVMNPPFHQGKAAQPSIGTDFIKTAAAALKPGGHLHMVANAHLPYESVLGVCFKHVEKKSEEKGFKIFDARK